MGPAVTATFGGDTSGLRNSGEESEGIVRKFAEKCTESFMEMGKALLGAFAVERLFESLKEFVAGLFEEAERLQNLSRELGVTTAALQTFDFMVRESGGTAEAARKAWEHSRDMLDQLRAGSETAGKAFAALGLSAEDFVGLDLDHALEKIAQAYVENADNAGSYDAAAQILGKRTLPQVISAFKELGEQGLDPSIQKMHDLGHVTNDYALNVLANLKREGGSAWDEVKKKSSEYIANLIIAYDWLMGMPIPMKKLLDTHREENAVMGETTEHLKEHKAKLEDILTLQDHNLRSVIEISKGQEKLTALAAEYVSLNLTANSTLHTQAEREAAAGEAAKVKSEYEKYYVELQREEGKETLKRIEEWNKITEKVKESADKLKLEALPAHEKIGFLEQQRNDLLKEQMQWEQGSYQWMELQVKLNEQDLTILKAKTAEMKAQAEEAKKAKALANQGKDDGLMFLLGGLRTYDNPAQQREYEEQTVAGYVAQLTQELNQRQQQLSTLQNQPSSPYSSYLASQQSSAIAGLRFRINHAYAAVFDPNYSDDLGGSVLGQQIAWAGGSGQKSSNEVLSNIHTLLKNTLGNG